MSILPAWRLREPHATVNQRATVLRPLLALLAALITGGSQAEPGAPLMLRLEASPLHGPLLQPTPGQPSRDQAPASPVQAALSLARLALAQGQAPQAIRTLTEILGQAQGHELAEAAALLLLAGESRFALDAYARLMQTSTLPNTAWLGLAIALDETGHADAARRAYLRAVPLVRDPEVRAYIGLRLRQLAVGMPASAP